jgi:hypothetical protein
VPRSPGTRRIAAVCEQAQPAGQCQADLAASERDRQVAAVVVGQAPSMESSLDFVGSG